LGAYLKKKKKITGNKDQTGNCTKVAVKPRSREQRLAFQGLKGFTWNSERITLSRYLHNKRNHSEPQDGSDLATSVWPCPKIQQITEKKIYYFMYS
jgi:hypothetical protein